MNEPSGKFTIRIARELRQGASGRCLDQKAVDGLMKKCPIGRVVDYGHQAVTKINRSNRCRKKAA